MGKARRRAAGRVGQAASTWRLSACLLASGLGAGCELRESTIARSAPSLLVGLSANDLRLCAGLPDRTAIGTADARYWSYERFTTFGTGTVTLPQIGVSLSGAEECRMTVELVEDRVRRIAFARTASPPSAPKASCAPLVQSCVEMIESGRLARQIVPSPER